MQVFLNSQGYSYDVHSLVKAFYPEQDVKIEMYEEKGLSFDEGLLVYVSSGEVDKEETVSGVIECRFRDFNNDKEVREEYKEADRTAVKSLLKRVLYGLLSDITGKSLPWGTLTGIRPTKIPMKMICEGKNDFQIKEYMQDEYLCSEGKISLATSIAHLEKNIVDSVSSDGYSLYIGIPFCPTTCLYCSFTSYPIVSWAARTGEYLECLKKEILSVRELFPDKAPDSVYIGGGTPTTLTAEQLRELIDFVRRTIDCSKIQEFTVEAGRPDSITEEKLIALYESGVTRLSINPQTMNDKTLKIIGRQHTVSQIYDAFEMARRIGFDNINTDLILGLLGEDEEDVKYTFDKIKELAPDSITVHSMAIKRAAGMHKFLDEHDDIKSINTPGMLEMAEECARSLGMDPYYLYRQKNMSGNFENVGYARKGKYGIYNILIMEEVQTIIACGAGTVTKRVYGDGRIERCDNVKDVALYISKIEEMIDRKRQLFAD